MNSDTRPVPVLTFRRVLPLLVLALASASLFSGCARLKQYSVDSWQGPLPMQDLRYVEVDPGVK